MTDERFAGKNIIITGAGGNFGREGCIFFSQRGANIVGLDNSEPALNATIEQVAKTASNNTSIPCCHGYLCDVTSAESVEKAVERAAIFFKEQTGRASIDMLWNNAGYQGQIAPTLEYDPVDFAMVMNINVTGMFIVLQSVAKRMAAESERLKAEGTDPQGFSIVNTGSVAGLRGTPAMVAYASSKAAVLSMTISTAKVRTGIS
jgi:NAD(P)-dependent dehydrogenase (short-subunit alcohol dehydrogenase family)